MHYSYTHAGLAALAIVRATAQDTLTLSAVDDFSSFIETAFSSTTSADSSSTTDDSFGSDFGTATSTTSSSGSASAEPTITGMPVTVYQMSAVDDPFAGAISTDYDGPVYASIIAVVRPTTRPSPFLSANSA
jgi:hypothetical protein